LAIILALQLREDVETISLVAKLLEQQRMDALGKSKIAIGVK